MDPEQATDQDGGLVGGKEHDATLEAPRGTTVALLVCKLKKKYTTDQYWRSVMQFSSSNCHHVLDILRMFKVSGSHKVYVPPPVLGLHPKPAVQHRSAELFVPKRECNAPRLARPH